MNGTRRLRRNVPLWAAVVGGQEVTAYAPTKSEARAQMKRALGLPRRPGLPPGTKLARVAWRPLAA